MRGTKVNTKMYVLENYTKHFFMISDQILTLRRNLIGKIRAYASQNNLKAYRIAQIAGISETAVRDFESESWNPLFETLMAIELIMPQGWEPTTNTAEASKIPIYADDVDPQIILQGKAGRLSRAHAMVEASDHELTPRLISALKDEGVFDFSSVIVRDGDGEFRIQHQTNNNHLFGHQYSPSGKSVRDKPDKLYGKFVAERMQRCWETQEPLAQHLHGHVKGGRLLNTWILLLPMTGPDSFGPDTILSVSLPVWERRELGLE